MGALEIFQSLPDNTDINAFTFMGYTVSAQMDIFRQAIIEAQRPVPQKKNLPREPKPRSRAALYYGIGAVAVVAIIGVGLAMGGVKVTNLMQKFRGWWA